MVTVIFLNFLLSSPGSANGSDKLRNKQKMLVAKLITVDGHKIYTLLVYMQDINSKLVIELKSANGVSKLYNLIHYKKMAGHVQHYIVYIEY